MTASALDAARDFLTVVREGASSLDALARTLDQLALAIHDAPPGAMSDSELEPPSADYETTYARLAERYPELGLYAVADPLEIIGEALVGDAIDDLADLVGDLSEVLWRKAQLGDDDAYWWFAELFRIHWGEHLRSLSFYLHAVRTKP